MTATLYHSPVVDDEDLVGLGRREPVDLAAVTCEVRQSPGPAIARQGGISRSPLSRPPWTVPPVLIERLTADLIGNAVGGNIPGGSV